MDQSQLNWITNFIWGIADDVLRDLYVRGKYRDVILPMTVLRRLDAVLEPTKQAVLEMKATLDEAGIVEPRRRRCAQAAGQAFYNTSPFTPARPRVARKPAAAPRRLRGLPRRLFARTCRRSSTTFEFRNQIPRLSKADALGTLIEKFLDPSINLSPQPVLNSDGSVSCPASTTTRWARSSRSWSAASTRRTTRRPASTGRRATPCELMANLIFLPIADEIESGTYLLYDGACGTGGMLTVAEETLQQLAREARQAGRDALYGQEINAETYAICKADLLLKGEGESGGQHRRRPGVLDALERRLPVPRVRLHALESALRQELEERPRAHGRQGRACATRASSSSTPAIRSTRSSRAPATARCCSWRTCCRR